MLSRRNPPVCQVYYYQWQKLKTKEQREKDFNCKNPRNPKAIMYVDEYSFKKIQNIEAKEEAEKKRKMDTEKKEKTQGSNKVYTFLIVAWFLQ